MSKKKNTEEVEFVGMSSKRLTYQEMRAVCDSLTAVKPYKPYGDYSLWWRTGENEKYAYESNEYTLDHRIIEKETKQEVWSYYTDYYTG